MLQDIASKYFAQLAGVGALYPLKVVVGVKEWARMQDEGGVMKWGDWTAGEWKWVEKAKREIMEIVGLMGDIEGWGEVMGEASSDEGGVE